MARLRLHLDADASSKTLQKALQERGHDVTRTPIDWMPMDASDEMQLLRATARGRCIFTFNIVDFLQLVQAHPEHHGLIVANQRHWTISTLIAALDRMFIETTADEWIGQVRWLNDWPG
jgi:hypothetical protein